MRNVRAKPGPANECRVGANDDATARSRRPCTRLSTSASVARRAGDAVLDCSFQASRQTSGEHYDQDDLRQPPFSASSASAIVALVIVESPWNRWVGRTSTFSGTTMATPAGIAVAARQAASGFALRALPRRKTYTTSWEYVRLVPHCARTAPRHSRPVQPLLQQAARSVYRGVSARRTASGRSGPLGVSASRYA